jgi:hypothetical protein
MKNCSEIDPSMLMGPMIRQLIALSMLWMWESHSC